MDVEVYFLTVYSQNKLYFKIKYDISLSVLLNIDIIFIKETIYK